MLLCDLLVFKILSRDSYKLFKQFTHACEQLSTVLVLTWACSEYHLFYQLVVFPFKRFIRMPSVSEVTDDVEKIWFKGEA